MGFALRLAGLEKCKMAFFKGDMFAHDREHLNATQAVDANARAVMTTLPATCKSKKDGQDRQRPKAGATRPKSAAPSSL